MTKKMSDASKTGEGHGEGREGREGGESRPVSASVSVFAAMKIHSLH
jgi:hypothetical protein